MRYHTITLAFWTPLRLRSQAKSGNGRSERNHDVTDRTLSTLALCTLLLTAVAGCGNRPGWGFTWGQGTTAQQKARATVHDPFPLNDIGPEVVGGRPREFYNPQPEAVRNQNTRNGY